MQELRSELQHRQQSLLVLLLQLRVAVAALDDALDRGKLLPPRFRVSDFVLAAPNKERLARASRSKEPPQYHLHRSVAQAHTTSMMPDDGNTDRRQPGAPHLGARSQARRQR